MSKANKIIVLIGLVFLSLIVSNPNDVRFLNRIGQEYGSVHHGLAFSPGQLLEIGKGERSNFIIVSSYRYEFGNISVEYIGLAGFIWKTGSSVSENPLDQGKTHEILV